MAIKIFKGNEEVLRELTTTHPNVYKKEEILFISQTLKIGKFEWAYMIHEKRGKRFGDYILKKDGIWGHPSKHSKYNINKAFDNYGLPQKLITHLVDTDQVQNAISEFITLHNA